MLLASAAAIVLSGCVSGLEDQDDQGGPEALLETRPQVEVLYPEASDPKYVDDNDAEVIKTDDADSVIYFTVRVPYLCDDSDGKNPKHELLHYVIGGYDKDDTIGHVVVNGVKRDDDGNIEHKPGDGVALISVKQGWVWVSDCPPPNWADCEEDAGVAPQALDALEASLDVEGGVVILPVNDVWAGWSILTLLKAEWTWAGAIGTRFIYRVDPAGSPVYKDGACEEDDDSPGVEKVYSLDGEPAQHSARMNNDKIKRYQVDKERFRRAINNSHPENPVQYELEYMPGYPADKDFVKFVEARVEEVEPE